jgi:ABC-type Mn2+/Zn2+ transport system permease subunit
MWFLILLYGIFIYSIYGVVVYSVIDKYNVIDDTEVAIMMSAFWPVTVIIFVFVNIYSLIQCIITGRKFDPFN